jgi:prepilin-type N-terminal cleavage/methylation domain-containing protein
MSRISATFRTHSAFTLIELLIVVAIIAILAAIAVPNFLEAQTRAKVSRVKADLRSLATGIEAYRVDTNRYPDGTDSPNNYDERIGAFLGSRAAGFCTLKTRVGTALTAGRDFQTVTTPVAYVSAFFTDPFAAQASGYLTYSYFPSKKMRSGWILTSFGPDTDILEDRGGKPGCGTSNPNPLGTLADTKTPARLGDINEEAIPPYIERSKEEIVTGVDALGGLRNALEDLAYDPTNGTTSEGDLYRIGP